jgi:hypothetical protein
LIKLYPWNNIYQLYQVHLSVLNGKTKDLV